MEKIIAFIKNLYNQFVAWAKENMPTVYIILAAAAALFLVPFLYKKYFKRRRTTRRRRTSIIRRPTLRKGRAGTGKGSEYMRRKMARLRAMRRRKRK
jgi:hypothetical protein